MILKLANNFEKLCIDYYRNLFKLAASDLPDYTPEYLRERLKDVDKISDLVREIPIDEYEENIENQNEFKYDVDEFSEICTNALNQFKKNIYTIQDSLDDMSFNLNENNLKLLKNVFDNVLNIKLNYKGKSIKEIFAMPRLEVKFHNNIIKEPYTDRNGVLITPSNMVNVDFGNNLINFSSKLYELLSGKYKNLGLTINARYLIYFKNILEGLPELNDKDIKNQFSNVNYILTKKLPSNLRIIFSKKPIDVLTMSTRSDWNSCQNFLTHKARYVEVDKAVRNKYIGIIYVTDNSNIKGHTKMIARSLVLLTVDDDLNEYIYVNKTYSDLYESIFHKVFLNSIKNHTNLPIISYENPSKKINIIHNNIDKPYVDKNKKYKNMINDEENYHYNYEIKKIVKNKNIDKLKIFILDHQDDKDLMNILIGMIDPKEYKMIALVLDSMTDDMVIDYLHYAKNIDDNIYLKLFENKNLHPMLADDANSPFILDKLSDDSSEEIRFRVAFNKYTSEETLIKLSDDPSLRVKRAVMNNTKCPLYIKEKLSKEVVKK